jgi:hypothetical protein
LKSKKVKNRKKSIRSRSPGPEVKYKHGTLSINQRKESAINPIQSDILSIDHEKEHNQDIYDAEEATIQQDKNDFNDLPEEDFKHTTLIV